MVLEEKQFQEFTDKLVTAFTEESDDVLTLVTVIDLYADSVNIKGSFDQKSEFLQTLWSLLQQHKEMVAEIGWDLPKIVIRFIHWSNINQEHVVYDNSVLRNAMRCFNEVALFGNAKECFFTACELLSTLSLNDDSLVTFKHFSGGEAEEESSAIPDIEIGSDFFNRGPQELILELRLHAVIELINTTLKRITTMYPSRFFGEAVQALHKFVSQNSNELDDSLFILRRIYSFLRGYFPPTQPLDAKEKLTKEELDTIDDYESAIQRKLLRHILTFSIGQLSRYKTLNGLLSFCDTLQSSSEHSRIKSDYYKDLEEILSRFYQLAISFDIDLDSEFQRVCIAESKRIYRSLPPDSEITTEEEQKKITQFVYQLAYTYEMEKIANVKEISLDASGLLCLASITENSILPPKNVQISVADAIYMYLRFVTPSLHSVLFDNRSSSDCCRMWILYALTNSSSSDAAASLKTLPSYLVNVFLQVELIRASNQINDELRRLQFSLLTRVLCTIPEETTFDFIKDTLLSCPYEHAKCCVLAILKDLMIRQRKSINSDSNTDDLASEVAKLEISHKPSLPLRSFVLLNEDRMATIHSLTLLNIEKCVKEPNASVLTTLLTYLNFYHGLCQKWDKPFLQEICDKISKEILLEENLNGKEPQYGMIKISLEALSKKM